MGPVQLLVILFFSLEHIVLSPDQMVLISAMEVIEI